MNREDKFRFFSHVKISDGCWEWESYVSKYGYGQFRWNGRMWNAQIISYKFCVGPVPTGLCVCHSCDNRKCVRPSHLWIGTRAQNNIDRKIKGRNRYQNNDSNSNAVLNWNKVELIREERIKGRSIPFLARRYKVGTSTIHRVIRNQNWVKS